MEWVEISAKTVEEAKELALDRLGVDERDAEFDIMEEPRTGIFGRSKGDARVRARVKPAVPRAKAERRDRKRERPDRPARAVSGRSSNKETPATAEASSENVDVAEPTGAESSGAFNKADRPTRNRDEERTFDHDLADLNLDEQANVVSEVVTGVIAALGSSATVSTRQIDDDTAVVSIDGDQLGFLVGPRGRTLNALNEVARSVVLRRGNTAPSARVHVDVAGYRQRRRDALAAFSTATADQVRETGLAHVVEPMSSADRKVIHDTVAELAGVSSVSEGEDHLRRVVIVPA